MRDEVFIGIVLSYWGRERGGGGRVGVERGARAVLTYCGRQSKLSSRIIGFITPSPSVR